MRPYVWFQAEVVDMDQEVQFLLYNMPEDSGKVQVVIKDETIWCTQKAMAQLFGVGVPAVSKHLKNIFEEGELMADSVISKMETTATDAKTYETSYYSLDAIIAVGYRVCIFLILVDSIIVFKCGLYSACAARSYSSRAADISSRPLAAISSPLA